MPQGGILPGESPREAAFRELHEETGIVHAKVVAELDGWLTCDLPADLIGLALKGRYRGHRMKWFAMRFTGEDGEIDLGPREGCKAEFDAWRWSPAERVVPLAVEFKREMYRQVMAEAASLIEGGQSTRCARPAETVGQKS